MKFAYINGRRITPDQYKDEFAGNIFCGDNHPVIIKRGEKHCHHFSHKSGSCGCTADMSDWHSYHQGRIQDDFLEYRMEKDGVKHIADAYVNSIVIEYQHSPISKDTINKREIFYGDMIWVFDARGITIDIDKSKSKKDCIIFMKISGSSYMFDTNKTTYLDFGYRGYIEVLCKSKKYILGRYISFTEFDQKYIKNCIRADADKRIDRPKYNVTEKCSSEEICELTKYLR